MHRNAAPSKSVSRCNWFGGMGALIGKGKNPQTRPHAPANPPRSKAQAGAKAPGWPKPAQIQVVFRHSSNCGGCVWGVTGHLRGYGSTLLDLARPGSAPDSTWLEPCSTTWLDPCSTPARPCSTPARPCLNPRISDFGCFLHLTILPKNPTGTIWDLLRDPPHAPILSDPPNPVFPSPLPAHLPPPQAPAARLARFPIPQTPTARRPETSGAGRSLQLIRGPCAWVSAPFPTRKCRTTSGRASTAWYSIDYRRVMRA